MIVKVGERIFSSATSAISIRLTEEEYNFMLSRAVEDDFDKREPGQHVCIVMGPVEKGDEEDLKEWSREYDLSGLCSCDFCVCTTEDKLDIAKKIGDIIE